MVDPRHRSRASQQALRDIWDEYNWALNNYGPFRSAHEGYAIIKEEVEELWDEIKKKPAKRDDKKLYGEAKQIGAMALRFMVEASNRRT